MYYESKVFHMAKTRILSLMTPTFLRLNASKKGRSVIKDKINTFKALNDKLFLITELRGGMIRGIGNADVFLLTLFNYFFEKKK